ncbi:hypothetical protein PROAA_610025 [Candidatus Propionivibrio aalborgensis]|uniref:Uncharacterized protein n=1 Tax=Candidatus Propionivibrio aalborgensis TaxID=1860101 RepID=A0A1A8Y0H4_9RHOO|nr:hypothetical protein [Candidatus Propionivibrio aalborgensis]SBT10665.1 hypothetical protein PROAA_610025 [Candidatus Propionivibrio aalborgensis]
MKPQSTKLRDIKRRAARALKPLSNTCPSSRLVYSMALGLSRGEQLEIDFDPRLCAGAMLTVLEDLWKARARLAEIDRENAKVWWLVL